MQHSAIKAATKSHRERLFNLGLRVNMEKSVLLPFPVLDSAHSSARLNVRWWTSWIRRRGAFPVCRWRVSSLPHSLDPANPGWCGVIGASEETHAHATQRTVVMEITQSYLSEWPFYPVLLLCLLFRFTVRAKGTSSEVSFSICPLMVAFYQLYLILVCRIF